MNNDCVPSRFHWEQEIYMFIQKLTEAELMGVYADLRTEFPRIKKQEIESLKKLQEERMKDFKPMSIE